MTIQNENRMADSCITGWCSLTENLLIINGDKKVLTENFINFAARIKALFKQEQISYPKFYKMDNLSKLGFLTAEMVFRERRVSDLYPNERVSVIISNSSSSLDTDTEYFETIRDKSNYYPSPSVFVYTLPNILIGEICIRNRIKGENAFFVSEKFEPGLLFDHADFLFRNDRADACLCGRIELMNESFESFLVLAEKRSQLENRNENPDQYQEFTIQTLSQLYSLNKGN